MIVAKTRTISVIWTFFIYMGMGTNTLSPHLSIGK
jgi:hypothetical protein